MENSKMKMNPEQDTVDAEPRALVNEDTAEPSQVVPHQQLSQEATERALHEPRMADPDSGDVVDLTQLPTDEDKKSKPLETYAWHPDKIKPVQAQKVRKPYSEEDEAGATHLSKEQRAEILAPGYIPHANAKKVKIPSGHTVLEFYKGTVNTKGEKIVHKYWSWKNITVRVSRLDPNDINPFQEYESRQLTGPSKSKQ